MRQGIVLIGFAASLLLLTMTMFISISINSSRQSLSLKEVEQTAAKQAEKTKPTAKNQQPPRNDDKVLQEIDTMYSYEESLQ